MTKLEFLEKLTAELKRNNVPDAADIIDEYQQHFAFKLADGYPEEEIAAKLGDPAAIAAQYDAPSPQHKGGRKAVTVLGLGAADFFFGILCVLLCAWQVVMAACAAAFTGICVTLIGGLGRFPLFTVPQMPYPCALILGVAFGALAVLSAVGGRYFWGFIRQLTRAFGRFHKNSLAAASGRAALPPLPVYPQFSAKVKRRLRRTATVAAAVFAVCFVAGFAACVIAAGAFEFWHTWGWFGYGG